MVAAAQRRADTAAIEVAQISNLLYRRFPIGRRRERSETFDLPAARRLEALRYSRLEICATRFTWRQRVKRTG